MDAGPIEVTNSMTVATWTSPNVSTFIPETDMWVYILLRTAEFGTHILKHPWRKVIVTCQISGDWARTITNYPSMDHLNWEVSSFAILVGGDPV